MDKNAYIAWAVFAVVCLIILIVSKRMNKQTEENGIETTGVISRIEDTGDANDIDICYYARYRTEDGDEVEGILSNPTDDLAVGQEVRLKYHPVYKMNEADREVTHIEVLENSTSVFSHNNTLHD